MDAHKASSPFKAPLFTILAGDSAAEYHVHASVLCQSSVLAKMVEGDWSETRDSKLVWKQWSVEGVERLIAWLYRGDYQCPLPSRIVTQEEADSRSSQLSMGGKAIKNLAQNFDDAHWVTQEHTRINKKGRTSPSNPPSDLIDLEGKTAKSDGAAALPSIVALAGPDPGTDSQISEGAAFEVWSSENVWKANEWQWEAILMIHAELYVMACHYELSGLKAMSWQRLRTIFNVLGSPEPGSIVYEEVLNFAHYVYTETGTIGDEQEPLRTLVSTFAALNFPGMQGLVLEQLFAFDAHSIKEFIVDMNDKVAIRMKSLAEYDQQKRPEVGIKSPQAVEGNDYMSS
ncbi:MAG: hypothetical protein Q9174_002414 [Haloplaca sp. 1 TL-2023]